MRRLLLASVLALPSSLTPGLGVAEPVALSAEIGSKGITATAARLAGLAQPNADELFALAGLQFLTGIEAALQLRWQTGLQSDWSELPILRLPIPENPAPRPFTGADLNAMLAQLQSQMQAARQTLARLETQPVAVPIALQDLWFDINANGARDSGEGLDDVAGLMLGRRGGGGALQGPVIHFDTADAAWLTAYTHMIAAFVSVAQAYDPGVMVDQVTADAAAMKELGGDKPANSAWDYMFGKQVDRVAIILQALAQQPDAQLAQDAHAHLLQMISHNRRFWALVEAETDNDHEWIPNDRQQSALGLSMPEGTGARWQAVLVDAEKILKGELLVPHWRYGAGAGINIYQLFQTPPPVDLVGMVQGGALLAYAQKGPQASMQSWNDFESMVWGDSLLFAVWFN